MYNLVLTVLGPDLTAAVPRHEWFAVFGSGQFARLHKADSFQITETKDVYLLANTEQR